VWDNAAFDKAKAVGAVGVKRIYQPPYSPEVNPVEGLRRWVEGKVWGRIEAKQAAVEAVLERLMAEGRVRSLIGWNYISQALHNLPQ